MRTTRALLAALALALSLVVLIPATSYACSCAVAGVRDFVDRADVVVVGAVTDRQDPPVRPVTSSADPVVEALTGPGHPPAADGADLPRFTTVGMPDDTPGAGGPSAWTLALGGAGAAALLAVGAAVALVLRANRAGT